MAEPTPQRLKLLRSLPSVEEVQRRLGGIQGPWRDAPREEVTQVIREVLSSFRERIIHESDSGLLDFSPRRSFWMEMVEEEVRKRLGPSLRRLINATGVVIHTNLGRSLLAHEAVEAVREVGLRYSNLEFDLSKGQRGSRYVHVERLLCALTGAPAAMVVNNNAAAVLLCLQALAFGKEVVVSRGELVEIGGSFRMPDVMRQSGAILVEVGTTNKTKLSDYEEAIGPNTALLLKVHTSNYRIVGFTQEVTIEELASLGKRLNIPVMMDLGSGAMMGLDALGQDKDPTVQEVVSWGADIVTFSGDKLLGGPQAGIILGSPPLIETIRKNPLTRALRIDKLTLAALEATLRLYWDPEQAMERLPTLRMLHIPLGRLRARAYSVARRLKAMAPSGVRIRVLRERSQVGGGAMPLADLPSWVVALSMEGTSAFRIEERLRMQSPPIIGRIFKDEVLLDMRTVLPDEINLLCQGVLRALEGLSAGTKGGEPD